LAAADEYTPTARLRIEQPAKVEGIGTYHPTEKFNNARDAFEVPLKSSPTEVVLSDSQ
jgi:hypothetical protein